MNKQLLKLNLQHFASPETTFNPDNVTMQSAKTGAIPIGLMSNI